MVYVVRCGDETRCAKVYKEATQRSFRQAVDYTENRKVKNTRQARAMAKGTRFGRQAQEAAWQSAEVDALHRLAAAGVRVPKPLQLPRRRAADGAGGRRERRRGAAPQRRRRSRAERGARAPRHAADREVVRMLCAGVVHGDLSEFNILLAADGPVIIDLPQAVDAAGNNHAQAHAAARRRQPARVLRAFRARSCSRTAATAPRSGRSTRAACCSRRRRLTRALRGGGAPGRRRRRCCARSTIRSPTKPSGPRRVAALRG